MESKNPQSTNPINLIRGGKTRESNLELYRVVCMSLIVAHHYVVNSGVMGEVYAAPMSANSLFLFLLGMWGKTGINCFVLITGYFMCQSDITIRKFLKLALEVIFYNVVIWALFVLTGYRQFDLHNAILTLVPVRDLSKDFTSCFLVFYLLIPFLNIMVRNMTRTLHLRLMVVLLVSYTFLPYVPKLQYYVVFNYVTWFCILYVLASYIRFYGLLPKLQTRHWGWCTLISVLLAMASVLYFVSQYKPYFLMFDTNAPFAVIVAVCSFMLFKGLPITYSRFINLLGASTFGVLLIHANSDTMRCWLWRDTVDCIGQYGQNFLPLLSIGSIIAIFAICIVIDYVRIHTVEKWTFRYVDQWLAHHHLA